MIRHLLFDIGTVTLHMNFADPAKRMHALCRAADVSDPARFMKAFYADPMLVEYECGRVDTAAFVGHFVRRLGFEGSRDDFIAIWRSVFTPNKAVIALIRELAATHGIYYFSNTGEMHVPWVYERFPEMAVHRGHALSYEIGVMKPDPFFFTEGLRRLRLKAEDCLFIDDLAPNVAAARSVGIAGIHYTAPDDAIARIRRHLDGASA